MRKYEPNIPQFATLVPVTMSNHFALGAEQLFNGLGFLRRQTAEPTVGFRILISMAVNEKNIL